MSVERYLEDVRKYDSAAEESVVAGIVRYLGIALRSRDASLVSGSDPAELERVREKLLKKKFALSDPDATLDAAIKRVMETMKADRSKERVTVYYLLAAHFGKKDLFVKKA
jgi:hypothetical protein